MPSRKVRSLAFCIASFHENPRREEGSKAVVGGQRKGTHIAWTLMKHLERGHTSLCNKQESIKVRARTMLSTYGQASPKGHVRVAKYCSHDETGSGNGKARLARQDFG